MAKKDKQITQSPFSNFFRNASKQERERVMNEVLKKATTSQQETLEKAQAESALDLSFMTEPGYSEIPDGFFDGVCEENES